MAVFSLLALAMLVSCSHTPTSYGEGVRKDFVKGCVSPAPGAKGKSPSVCDCVYRKFEKNVPFKDFKKLEDELRAKRKPLDQLGLPTGKKAMQYLDQCQSPGSS